MTLGDGVECAVAESAGYFEHVAACAGNASLFWRVESDGTVVFVAAGDIEHVAGGDYRAQATGDALISSGSKILLQVGTTTVEVLPEKIKLHGDVIIDGGLWARDGLLPWATRPI